MDKCSVMKQINNEEWMLIHEHFINIYAKLYEIGQEYFIDDFEINEVIAITCLSYYFDETASINKNEMKEELISPMKINCKKYTNEMQNFLEFSASTAFIKSMKSEQPIPGFSPITENDLEIMNDVFAKMYLKGLSMEEVGKIYKIDLDLVCHYFSQAVQINKILLHGIAVKKIV